MSIVLPLHLSVWNRVTMAFQVLKIQPFWKIILNFETKQIIVYVEYYKELQDCKILTYSLTYSFLRS